MYKKILAALLIVVLSPLSGLAFSDVIAENPNFEAIKFIENLQIFEGSVFSAETAVNRGELFQILAKLHNVNNDSEEIEGVSENLKGFVGGLRGLGIRTRIGEAGFEENKSVNKVTALRMLLNIEGVFVPKVFNESKYSENLPNLPVSAYYSPVIAKALDLNLLNIKEGEDYNPLSKFTREDLAVMIANMEVFKSKLAVAEGRIPTIVNWNTGQGVSFLTAEQSQILETTWNTIDHKYVFQEDIDREKVFYGMMSGIVDSLGDPYSVFQTPEVYENFMQSLSDSLEGIGATLNIDEDGVLEIIAPLNGSPAQAAGIKAGDKILAIDGKITKNFSISESVNKIRGDAGTVVTLSILRGSELMDIEITRAKITIPYVEYEVSSKDIATVTINSFGDGVVEGFQEFVDEVDTTKLKGLVIDLRNNPGGFVDHAVNIADFFLEEGDVILQTQNAAGDIVKTEATGEATLAGLKTVILINSGSASAAEILAAALRENDQATLIGQQSFGKGTVQQIQAYIDGSSLKLSMAKWLTPNGTTIHHIGLTPDIEVEITEDDIENEVDAAMNKALGEF